VINSRTRSAASTGSKRPSAHPVGRPLPHNRPLPLTAPSLLPSPMKHTPFSLPQTPFGHHDLTNLGLLRDSPRTNPDFSQTGDVTRQCVRSRSRQDFPEVSPRSRSAARRGGQVPQLSRIVANSATVCGKSGPNTDCTGLTAHFQERGEGEPRLS